MTTRVPVTAKVLAWALHRSGASMSVIQEKFPKIHEWQSGESHPTLRQVEDFARATATPLGYFFLSKPPVDTLSIPLFRTVRDEEVDEPSVDLIETCNTMERRQAWLREYLIKQGQDPLPFVKSIKKTEKAETIAQSMRKALKLTSSWASSHSTWTDALSALEKRIESIGILVVVNGIVGNNTRRKLDPGEFRGFVMVDDFAPLVFVNGADSKSAQMFTLAHELAHVWLGVSAAFDLKNLEPANEDIELICNQAAAEFLVPAAELRSAWPSFQKSHDVFGSVARQFKVSQIVAARRALDLGLISKRNFLDFYKQYIARELNAVSESSGGNFWAVQKLRISESFAKSVIRATKKGDLLYREAYQLTGLSGNTFDELAKRVGVSA